MRVQDGGVGCCVLELARGKARAGRGVGQGVEGVGVDLYGRKIVRKRCFFRRNWGGRVEQLGNTFAILARRKDRTRNLNLSSSVWMIMRRKLALGSVLPVCSSTSSI